MVQRVGQAQGFLHLPGLGLEIGNTSVGHALPLLFLDPLGDGPAGPIEVTRFRLCDHDRLDDLRVGRLHPVDRGQGGRNVTGIRLADAEMVVRELIGAGFAARSLR